MFDHVKTRLYCLSFYLNDEYFYWMSFCLNDEYFYFQLQEVDLTNNRLTDISGLKGLPHLRVSLLQVHKNLFIYFFFFWGGGIFYHWWVMRYNWTHIGVDKMAVILQRPFTNEFV